MNKYGAIKTIIEGHVFDSKREARRYQELRLLQHAGCIRDLVLQPPFTLEVNGFLIGRYIADFAYVDTATGGYVVEDAKGVRTPEYRLKKKLMQAVCDFSHNLSSFPP